MARDPNQPRRLPGMGGVSQRVPFEEVEVVAIPHPSHHL